jgi:hypothetical protein
MARGVLVCRVANGRIVEEWDVDDRLDVMEQLGVFPQWVETEAQCIAGLPSRGPVCTGAGRPS